MSTLQEIEAAVEALPIQQQKELFRFLAGRLKAAGSGLSAGDAIDLRPFQGVLTLREEPLDYQARIRAEWS